MSAEAEVFGFEYLAHAAGAELSKNTVVRDGFAEQDSPDWGCILRGHGDGVNEVEFPFEEERRMQGNEVECAAECRRGVWRGM